MSTFAWWYLSKKQKKALQEQRRAGKFGGETGIGAFRAPYFWLQEGSIAEAAQSRAKAGIMQAPTRFVEKSIDAVNLEDVADRILSR